MPQYRHNKNQTNPINHIYDNKILCGANIKPHKQQKGKKGDKVCLNCLKAQEARNAD